MPHKTMAQLKLHTSRKPGAMETHSQRSLLSLPNTEIICEFLLSLLYVLRQRTFKKSSMWLMYSRCIRKFVINGKVQRGFSHGLCYWFSSATANFPTFLGFAQQLWGVGSRNQEEVSEFVQRFWETQGLDARHANSPRSFPHRTRRGHYLCPAVCLSYNSFSIWVK